jgi:hypothetical protein
LILTHPWIFQGKPYTETPTDYTGFVYHITFTTGQKYIGRKIFWSAKKKVVKGRVRRLKVESDWKKYHGSSDYIKTLLTDNKNDAKREIVRLCKSKSEMAYFEARLIFETDALLKPEYINRWITCQINSKNLEYLKSESTSECSDTESSRNADNYRQSIESIISDI